METYSTFSDVVPHSTLDLQERTDLAINYAAVAALTAAPNDPLPSVPTPAVTTASASASTSTAATPFLPDDILSFELSYNNACHCITTGDLNSAWVLLKQARDLCSSAPDLSDEEKAAELYPIMVQQLCVALALGHDDDAVATLAAAIPAADDADAAMRPVAIWNKALAELQISGINAHENPYLAHKHLSAGFDAAERLRGGQPQHKKLFVTQENVFEHNRLAMYLWMKRIRKIKRVAKIATA